MVLRDKLHLDCSVKHIVLVTCLAIFFLASRVCTNKASATRYSPFYNLCHNSKASQFEGGLQRAACFFSNLSRNYFGLPTIALGRARFYFFEWLQ